MQATFFKKGGRRASHSERKLDPFLWPNLKDLFCHSSENSKGRVVKNLKKEIV